MVNFRKIRSVTQETSAHNHGRICQNTEKTKAEAGEEEKRQIIREDGKGRARAGGVGGGWRGRN